MRFFRIIAVLKLMFCFNVAHAEERTIVIPLIEGCDGILKDKYIQASIETEPEVHMFDVRPEKFVHGLQGYAKLRVPDVKSKLVKDHISSKFTLCDGSSSQAILTREKGLVPATLVDELRFIEKYGDGKIIVVVEKEKDIRLMKVIP